MQNNLTLTEKLLRPHLAMDAPAWQKSWEVGRLVLDERYRIGQDLLKRCLYLSLFHLCATVDVDNLHASCTHVLSRLYRRFGFTTLEKNVLLTGTEKTYTLIHGHPPAVLAALKNEPAEWEPVAATA